MKLKRTDIRIDTPGGGMKAIMLRPEEPDRPVPGLLWIHGG